MIVTYTIGTSIDYRRKSTVEYVLFLSRSVSFGERYEAYSTVGFWQWD